MILGFDPGHHKCGLAVMDQEKHLYYHQVVKPSAVARTITKLHQEFQINLIVIGDQTTSEFWKQNITKIISEIPIIKVDERYSSLEARDRYWQIYPPQGLVRLIPPGMRIPSQPIDDIVAMILIERYLINVSK